MGAAAYDLIIEQGTTFTLDLTIMQSSSVVGTDGEDYRCILSHTAAAANKPTTGANYLTYWEADTEAINAETWLADTAYIYQVMNLTGYTARAQIRKKHASATATIDFTCTVLAPATDGKVRLLLTAAQTATIPAGESINVTKSQYQYDLEIVDENGAVTRIIDGAVYVSPEVTR